MGPLGDILAVLNDHYRAETIAPLYAKWLRPIHAKEAAWLDAEAAALRQARPDLKAVDETVTVLALIYGYKDLFGRLMAGLPEPIAQTFAWLVWTGPLTLAELARRLGEKPFKLSRVTSFEAAARLPVDWRFFLVAMTHQGKREIATLWLPEPLRALLRPRLPEPKTAAGPHGGDRPVAAEYEFVEDDPAGFLARCLAFAAGGSIRFAERQRRLRQDTLRQFTRQIPCRDLFPSGPHAPDRVRATLTLLFLGLAELDATALMAADAEIQARGAMGAYRRGVDAFGLYALPYLGGRGAKVHAAGGCGAETAASVLSLLARLPEDQWVAWPDLLGFARRRGLRALAYRPVPPWPAVHVALQSAIAGDPRPQRLFVNQGNHDELVAVPLLQAHLFLLASLGLLAVVYDRPRHPRRRLPGRAWLTPYDGLRGLRLTAWGGALLHGKKAPILGKAPVPSAILDPNALIVTLAADDKTVRAYLVQVARPLGPHRFKLDFASFVRGARDPAGLDAAIALFRQTVCASPPPLWEAFFQEARTRVGAVQPEPDWLVFRASDDPHLLDALKDEPCLRRCVLRAESRRLLVRAADMAQVRDCLKKRGFLIMAG